MNPSLCSCRKCTEQGLPLSLLIPSFCQQVYQPCLVCPPLSLPLSLPQAPRAKLLRLLGAPFPGCDQELQRRHRGAVCFPEGASQIPKQDPQAGDRSDLVCVFKSFLSESRLGLAVHGSVFGPLRGMEYKDTLLCSTSLRHRGFFPVLVLGWKKAWGWGCSAADLGESARSPWPVALLFAWGERPACTSGSCFLGVSGELCR